MKRVLVVHKPGDGGLFDTSALCGATADPNLSMHAWDYNCPYCSILAGERGFPTPVGGVNDDGDLSSRPSPHGADDAPDESKGAAPKSAPAPLTDPLGGVA